MISAPAGKQVERANSWKSTHRVIRTEDGDGAGETDALRAHSSRGQDHNRRRRDEVVRWCSPSPEDVQPDLVGQFLMVSSRLRSRCSGLMRAPVAGSPMGVSSTKVNTHFEGFCSNGRLGHGSLSSGRAAGD